jgi:tryptophan-rich sensory protein
VSSPRGLRIDIPDYLRSVGPIDQARCIGTVERRVFFSGHPWGIAMQHVEADLKAINDDVPALVRSLLLPAIAATIGGIATSSSVKEWYPALNKPGFTPPSAIFGPVWTTLYLLMGIADHVVAQQGDHEEIHRARTIYRIQLGLNTLWSVLFFGRRSPIAGLVEIVFLWIAIVRTVIAFARISRLAALLLAPYLFWTSFALALNAAIWRLNR